MKGRIITGRAVVTDDFIKQGIIKGPAKLRPHDKNSRYGRQHKTKKDEQKPIS